jgi:uncharacterized membrane protein YkoI
MRMRAYAILATLLTLGAGAIVTDLVIAGRDHEEVRQLRRTGKILSLETILAKHRRSYPGGQLLEAELEFEQGRHVYDLKFLGDDGVVREFEYDARTGELWHLEQKPRR